MKDPRKFTTAIAFAVPVLLAIALTGVCIWGSETAARAESLERQVQSVYRQNLYELADNINDLQTTLKKLRVTASPAQHVLLLSEVWRLSGAATTNMAAIPDSHVDTAGLNAFIIRVGDYARSLEKRVLAGGVLLEEDYETISALYESSAGVGASLMERLNTEDFPSAAPSAEGYYESASGGEGESEESIADYPTLIYDGPFAESVEKAEARGLPAGEIGESEALLRAQAFLGGAELSSTGLVEGRIPAWSFSGQDANGRAVDIQITRQGGAVLWMMTEISGGPDTPPNAADTAAYKSVAKAWLDGHGYTGMEATYAQYYAGTAVLNFAAVQDSVILYADLVKVYVAREGCEVVGIDAANYLFSHTARELPAPDAVMEESEARYCVSDGLEIQSARLALIPKTALSEVLCYEYKGTCLGSSFIVYINAKTGAEEEIFEISNSDEGQLVV
ncbi:MAG: germination protein YpeB [Clostridia bacterium]|nr:germination protein YpeB [Clostridia bacterium]